MQQRGSGDYWGRSRAPSRGGQPYFANSALVLLIQHIAKTRDYERAVVPMAAGLSAFIALVDVVEDEGDVDEAGWRAIGKDVYKMNDLISEVVLADDPRQELQNNTEGSDTDTAVGEEAESPVNEEEEAESPVIGEEEAEMSEEELLDLVKDNFNRAEEAESLVNEEAESTEWMVCPTCSQSFTDVAPFDAHLTTVHPQQDL
jgi:hypothetical protein